jgi:hypothetical protein
LKAEPRIVTSVEAIGTVAADSRCLQAPEHFNYRRNIGNTRMELSYALRNTKKYEAALD